MEKDNKDIGVMAQAAAKMVRESVQAYVEQNMMLAKKVMTADDEVDRLFDKIRQEIIDYIARQGGEGGEAAVDLIMVAKYLERIEIMPPHCGMGRILHYRKSPYCHRNP